MSRLGLTLLVFVLIAAAVPVLGNGRLFTDEITGLTEKIVQIPKFSSEYLRTYQYTSGDLQATNPSGFKIATWGGIAFNADESVDIDLPSDFLVSASVTGNVDVVAHNVSLNGGDVNFASTHTNVFDATNMNFTTFLGDLTVDSDIHTRFEAADLLQVASVFRSLTISAPNGVTTLASNVISFSAGDPVDQESINLSSANNLDFNAGGVFDITTSDDLQIVGQRDVNLRSSDKTVDLRSFNTIAFSGGSNVDLRSENDFIIDSILNTVSVSATAEGAGYTGYHVLFDSDILTVSGSDAFFVTKGSVQFVDSNSNKLNFNTATFAADNANRFYTYHDLPITVSTLLNIKAPRVELRSSDHINIAPGNDVIFSTTKGTGDVHFQSPSFTFTGTGTSQTVSFTASAGSIDLLGESGFVDATGNVQRGTVKFTVNSLQSTSGLATVWTSPIITMTASTSASIDAGTNLGIFSGGLVELLGKNGVSISSSATFTTTSEGDVTFNAKNNDLTLSATDNIGFQAGYEFQADTVNQMTLNSAFNLGFTSPAATHINADISNSAPLTVTAGDNIQIRALEDKDDTISIDTFSTLKVTGKTSILEAGDQLDVYSLGGSFTVATPKSVQLTATDVSIISQQQVNSHATMTFNTNLNQLARDTSLVKTTVGGATMSASTSFFSTSEAATTINTSGFTVKSTAGNIHLVGEEGVFVTSTTDAVTITAADTFNVYGGGFTSSAITKADYTATNAISIHSENDSDFDFIAGNTITMNSNTWLRYHSANIQKASDTLTYHADSGALSFTTTGGDFTWESDTSSITLNAKGSAGVKVTTDNLQFWNPDDFTASLTAPKGSYTLTSGRTLNVLSGYDTTLNAQGSGSVTSLGQVVIDSLPGGAATFTQSSSTFVACDQANVRAVDDATFISSSGITFSKSWDPCGVKGTDPNAPYKITSLAVGTQTITAGTTATYTAPDIQILNGEIAFLARTGDINVNSSNAITFNSINDETAQYGPKSDTFDALKGTFKVDAAKAVHLTSTGVDLNESFRHFGIYLDTGVTTISDISYKAANGSFIATAAEDIFFGTSNPSTAPQNNHIKATQDITFTSAENFRVTSDGPINAGVYDPVFTNAGIQLETQTADMFISADKASLYLEGFRGITNKVTQGAATMKAGNSIFHSTARQNGNLLYNTPYGVITIDTGSDILLTAGTPTYDSAGVNTFASRDTNIISAGWQRYQHYGNSFLPNNIGIQLLADEGDITLTAGPNFNIEVDSSGHAAFTAQTGEINTIAQNDLILESDARVDFSSHQSALVQAINGFIDISAGGGGGHVLFQSDNNQDINVSAGKGVSIKAAANSRFEAVTGIVGKTNTGNIDFYNDGNDQDALFYSEGSILLQAKSATGAQFLARSLHAVAKNDFNIDAAAFTIGLTSLAVTNTEPIVSFGAGGDFDTDGLAIDSDGSVKLTTNKASSIAMVGDAFDLTAGQAISISANGNVLFSNSGILGDGSFIIETVAGVLTMNGQDDVIVSADTSNTLTTNGPFILQDNGVNAGNFVFMLSRRDFSLNAPNGKVAYTADTVEANLRDMTVDTVNNINFINPAGTGTLTFDSDRRLDITTLTGITLDAKSPSNIFTQGDLSHMTLRADNSDITASAGSNMFLQGTQIDIDGHNGLTVTSTLGSIALQSSAETRWAANKTINLEGRSLVTITAGDGTGDSTLIMKASGAFTANSTGDLRLTTQSNTDIVVIGDKRLTFRNLQAARAHDQGDITISANAGAVSTRTGGEVFYGVGGNLNVNTNKVMSTTAAGNISMKTTGAGANFLVQSKNDGIAIDGGANLHVYTQQSITYSSSTSFIGFAGVDTFAASLGNNALAFDKGALDIRATGAQADVVLTADIVNLLGSRGANITSASGAVVMSSTDVLITSNLGDTVLRADNADVNFIGGNSISSFAQSPNPDEPHVIFDAVAGGNSPNPAMSFTSQSIAISGATVNPNTHFTSNGNMVLSGAGAAMAFTANAGVLTVKATGQDPTAQYGIYMETDEINDFVSSGNLFLQALYGSVNSNAFEQTAIQASDIIARASDRLYIHSGFTQQPLALPPFRIAISVENTGNDVDLVTNSGDFIINADDVSFTATANMDLRASGPAGNINLDTESGSSIVATFATGLLRAHKGNAVMNQNTLTMTASSSTAITAEGSILISSSGAGITFTANAGTIVHTATESITLEAPVVDLRDTTGAVPTSIAVNRLLMPLLRYEADVTGNQASRFWWIEDNYRGCVNRQFGFDDTSRSMCICSNNKWECTYGNGGVNSQAYLPVGPQINTPLTVLTQSGWVQCHNSQADQVAAIPATCGTNGVSSVFMGCLDTNTNLITVGAVGTFNSIFNANAGGTYINANTFYRGNAAMGFKPAGDAFNTGGFSANNACDAAGGVDSQFRACFGIAGGNFNTFSSCGGVTAGANIRRVFFHNP